MTNATIRSERCADPCGREASSRRPAACASAPGALLRTLLAGAIALLVLLLPAQLAASRGGDDGRAGCRTAGCAIGDGALPDEPSRWDRISEHEIRRQLTCWS